MRIWNGTKRPPPTGSGRRRPLVALVGLAVVGVLAAGCGSNRSGTSSGGMGGASGTAPASGGASSVATVAATRTSLGMILVDGSGRTLYLFEQDPPNQSTCAGACAAAWPVDQTSGKPTAGSGVLGSLLGTIKRGDGSTQVTYNQHPLYYFHGDREAGQHNGQGVAAFGAKWFVVGPAGGALTSGGATPAPAPANGGGYGSSNGSGSGFGGY